MDYICSMSKLVIARLICVLTIMFIVNGQFFAFPSNTFSQKPTHFNLKQNVQKFSVKVDISVLDVIEIEEIEEDVDNSFNTLLNYSEIDNNFQFFKQFSFSSIDFNSKVYYKPSQLTDTSPIWISIRRINI